jgi:hypothetical protein
MDENVAVHTAIAVQNDSWELVLWRKVIRRVCDGATVDL